MPFSEVAGSTGAVDPGQSGAMALNVGTIDVVTVMLSVAVVAHWPASGVNAYVVVPCTAVLTTAGFQVPLIPFSEVAGNAGATDPRHTGPMAAKAGVSAGVTVTVMVVVVAHWPASGVNV
jgi:hypothetical protein